MSAPKKMQSPSGKQTLTARKAAKLLGCAPDYVSRLCREGKLEGVRYQGQWLIESASLARFEAEREAARIVRAESLATERREETRAFVYAKKGSIGRAAELVKSRFEGFAPSRHLVAVIVASFFFGSAALASGHFMLAAQASPATLPAALARVESPFFAPTFSSIGNALAKLAQWFVPGQGTLAIVPGTHAEQNIPQFPPVLAVSPAATSAPIVSAAPVTVINNTYPVIERTIVHTETISGISKEFFSAQLEHIFDSITDASSGGSVNFSDLTAADIPALDYLPLSGGALTGALSLVSVTSVATSTFAGLALSGTDCSVFNNGGKLTTDALGNIICDNDTSGAGSGTPGGNNTYVQFNDAGDFGGDAGFTYNQSADRLTVSFASTTGISSSYASSTSLFAGSATIGSLASQSLSVGTLSGLGLFQNGMLSAIATSSLGLTTTNVAEGSNLYYTPGRVQALINASTTLVQTSAAPVYGQVLVGNSSGGYTLTATSSLGITSAVWGNITGTLSNQTDLQTALNAKLTTTSFGTPFYTYFSATTTSALAEGSNLYYTLNRFASALAGTTTGALAEGSNLYYTPARFAAALAGTTTDALAQGTTNRYYDNALVQTYLNLLDKGYFFSTTSANYFVAASTTIPKTYLANTFTGNNIFSGVTTLTYASSTALTATNLYSTLASTSNLTISGLGNTTTECLQISASGVVSSAGSACGSGSGSITAIGPLGQAQTGSTITFATSTAGSDFTITGAGNTITFAIPTASASARGLITSADWTSFNNKISSTSLSGGTGIAYNSSTGVITNAIGYPFPSNATSTAIAFNGGLTASTLSVSGSSAFANASSTSFSSNTAAFGATGTTSIASTGALATPILTVGSLNGILKATAGLVSAATAGTDYATPAQVASAYPFPLTGNATSTLTQFNGGLTAFASSTIGSGAAAGGLTILGNATTTGLLFVTGSGTSSIANNLLIGGDITPALADTYSLGTAAYPFKHIFVGPGSLYVNGQKVISTNGGDDVVISSSPNENLVIQTTGTSNIELNPTGGQVQIKNTVNITAGKSITTTDLSALSIPNGVAAGNIIVSGNTISASNTNGDIAIAPNGNGDTYFTVGKVGIGTTNPGAKLEVQGQATAQYFTATSTTASVFPYASSTAITATNSFFATASTTNLNISGVPNALLKTVNGAVTAAVAGTDYQAAGNYATFGYLFPANATTTTIAFNGGLTAFASSTIGGGTQAGGLTIFGGATTTGNSYFAGNVGIGGQPSTRALEISGTARVTSTFTLGGIASCTGSQALQTNGSGDIACGSISVSGASSGGGWTTNNVGSVGLSTTTDIVAVGATSTPYAKLTVVAGAAGTTTLALVPASGGTANILDIYDTNGNLTSVFTATNRLGIGTTSPSQALSVGGNAYISGGATSTSLGISGLTSSLLKTNAQGTVVAASAGTDYENPLTFSGPLSRSINAISITEAGIATDGYLSAANFSVFNNKISSTSLSAGAGISYNSATGIITNTIGYPFVGNATTTSIAFNGGLTASSATITYASSTALTVSGIGYFGTASTTNLIATTATTTNFALTSVTSSLLKTNALGQVVAAIAGSDYLTAANIFAYPFPSNATTTNIAFNGGLTATTLNISSDSIFANATSTNLFGGRSTANTASFGSTGSTTVSSTGALATPGLTVGSLNGPLQANNGVVSATTSVGVLYGGTGLTAAPAYGNILVGNSLGGYSLTATSSLGLFGSSSLSATAPLAYSPTTGVISITQSGAAQNGYLSSTDWNTFNSKISSTSLSAGAGISYNSATGIITNTIGYPFVGNATTTSIAFNGGLTASSATITYASSTALTVSGIGYFGTASTTNLNISGVPNALLKTVNGVVTAAVAGTDYLTAANVFAYPFPSNATTTSIAFNGGLTAATINVSSNSIFANATSTNFFGGQITGNAASFGQTGSTTVAADGSLITPVLSVVSSASIASTTLTGNTLLTNATTTRLALTSITSSLLKTNAQGTIVAAVPGTDYLTSGTGVVAVGPLGQTQNGTVLLATSTAGSDFTVTATGGTVTFNLPSASSVARGLLTSADWSTFNNKISSSSLSSANTYLTYNSTTGVFTATTSPTYAAATSTTFSTTNLTVGTLTGLLKATAGVVSVAVAGTDYANFAYLFPSNATTTSIAFNGGLTASAFTLGALNGPLQANSGVVSATTSVGVLYGGTGLTSAPSFGNLLVGNSSGGYTLTATSSLGLLGSTSISASAPIGYSPTTGVISITQAGLATNGFLSSAGYNIFNNKVSSTSLSGGSGISYNSATGVITNTIGYPFVGNATTTSIAFNGGLTASSATITYASSTALTVSGIGYFGTASTTNLNISGVPNALLKTVNGVVTAAVPDVDYLTTGSIYAYPFIGNATTTNIAFNGGLTGAVSASFASTTLTGNTLLTNATTTRLALTSITSSLLKTNAQGTIVAASAGADYEVPLTFSTGLNRIGNTISNTGVTSATGTLNQISVSANTGDVTFSLPTLVALTNLTVASATSTNSFAGIFAANTARFGATATTTIDAAGNLAIGGTLTGAGLAACSGTADKLLWNAGVFSCGVDLNAAGGSSEINWTWFNGSAIRVSTSTNQVLIGANATTSLAKLEVVGGAFFDNATSSNALFGGAVSGNTARFGSTGTTTISASGNLGVGTTTGSERLVVQGGNILQVASGNPTLAGSFATVNQTYASVISGQYAYIADQAGGLRIADITNPKNPVFVGAYTGISAAVSVAVAGKYAYVGDTTAGIVVIDVSNPASPTLVSSINISASPWNLVLSGKYLYVAGGDSGTLKVVDVGNPAAPVIAGSWTPGASNLYGLAVAGKYAYVGDIDNARIHIVDISNPVAPARAGFYASSGITPVGLYTSGKYLYVADAGKGFYSINVANPASPALVGSYGPTETYYSVAVAGNYAYIAANTGNAVVLDLTASTTPRLVGSYATGGNPLGITVSGKYAYVSSNTAGLQVIDINGADLPSAHIGALEADILNVSDNLSVGNNIYAGGGLNVGISGIFSRGTIAAYIASTTQVNAVVASFMGGNVGIGTTSPTSALAVQGTAYFSSSAFFGGAITATSTLNVSGLSTFGNVAASNATSTSLFASTLTANVASFGQTGSTTIASNGALTTPSLTIGSLTGLLKATAGVVSVATAGVDYLTSADVFAYPFPNNATSTHITFNGGLTASTFNASGASTTILSLNGQSILTASTTNRSIFFGQGAGTTTLAIDSSATDNIGIGYQALQANTNGIDNIALGYQSLFSNTEGADNFAAGYRSLFSNTSGFDNIAIGNQALRSNTEGFDNIAQGASALQENTEGSHNIAFGALALLTNTTGEYNIALGAGALRLNTTGSYNIAQGGSALRNTTTGSNNIAQGFDALRSNTSGEENFAAGNSALYSNIIGSGNIAQGSGALYSNISGYDNFAAGYHALYGNTTGSGNIAQGFSALLNNTTGSQNFAAGYQALRGSPIVSGSITGYADNGSSGTTVFLTGDDPVLGDSVEISGTTNYDGQWAVTAVDPGISFDINFSFLGDDATGSYTTLGNVGSDNFAAGYQALYSNATGGNNIVQGYQALYANTAGSDNFAAGYQALFSNTTGGNNIAQGYQALYNNTTGSSNIAQGYSALSSNTSGSGNLAQGYQALLNNTEGGGNIALGESTLALNITGSGNNAQGFYALTSNTTGSDNIANGGSALYNNSTGSKNVALGDTALASNIDGSKNIALGSEAGDNLTSGDNNVIIGANSIDFASDTASNQLNIQNIIYGINNAGTGSTLSTGSIGIGTTTPGSLFSVGDTNGINFSTATSTFSSTGGINLKNGCYAVNGTCLTSGTDVFTLDGGENLFAGTDAFVSNFSGTNNFAAGFEALTANETGLSNFAAGYQALHTNDNGSNNFASGYQALFSNENSNNNTAIGFQALYSNAFGSNNLALGNSALYNNQTGAHNIAQGLSALYNNTTGSNNIALGNQAFRGGSIVTGTITEFADNGGGGTTVFITGSDPVVDDTVDITGTTNYDGTWNVIAVNPGVSFDIDTAFVVDDAAGAYTTRGNTGNANIALGVSALTSNTTGSYNLAQGQSALRSNTTGTSNLAQGLESLYSNTTGSNNIAQGTAALFSNTDGANNIAQGVSALRLNTSGSSNFASGYQALFSNTIGSDNIAQGYGALRSNVSGNDNVALGVSTLYSNITGSNNIAQGNSALFNNTAGSYNVALGYQAGDNLTEGDNNVIIGKDINFASSTASNQLNIQNILFGIDNAGTGSTLSTGSIGIGTTTPGAKLGVQGDILAAGKVTAGSFVATSTTASILPYASSTALTATNLFSTNATTTTLGLTGVTSSLLKTNAQGTVVAAVVGTDYLSSAITAFGATGQTQTGATQTLATSTTGTDFTITSSGNVTTFNLPIASSVNTGKLSAADWAVFNNKISSTSIDTSAELLALVTDETGTGALVFAGSPTLTGTITAAAANFSGNVMLASATSTNLFSGRTTANTAAFGQTGSTTVSSTGALSTPGLTVGSLSGVLYGATGAINSTATGTVASSNGITVTAGQSIIGSGLTITGVNAAADGSTKGVASFNANDFDATTGNISIDYATGQAANASTKGFLVAADWSVFNNKISSTSIDTSAELAALLTDETGTGAAVFGTSPTFSGTPVFSGGTINYSVNSTSTVPNNSPFAWTIATSTTGTPLFRIDTTSGAEAVTLGGTGADVTIGDVGASANLVFEENSTIKGQAGGRALTFGGTGDVINFAVNTGFGSTSPYAKLAVQATAGQINPVFEVASSSSASKFLSVSATGFGTTTLSGLNISGSATSTSNVGFNITSGCYAVGGTCLTSGITSIGPVGQGQTGSSITFATSTTGTDFTVTATGNTVTFNLPNASSANTGKLTATDWSIFNNKISSTSLDTSAELLALVTDETGTGSLVFGTNATLTGTTLASTTLTGNFVFANATGTSATTTNFSVKNIYGAPGDAISIRTGNTTGTPGNVIITGGNNTSGAVDGGSIVLSGGSSANSNGGGFTFNAGQGPDAASWGAITFNTAGISAGFDNSGQFSINSGKLFVGSGVGGGTTYVGIGTTTPFARLAVNPVAGDTNQFVVGSSTGTSFIINNAGRIGIGTTSPYAKLVVQATAGQTNPVFEVASSSNSSKFLSVAGDGFGTTTVSGLNIAGSATSTSNVGLNLTAGCFAINGTCLPTSSGITAFGATGQTQTGATQTLATSTTGTDFTITSSGNVTTFNLPTASAAARGLLTSADWSTFNNKVSSTSIDTSAELLALVTDETGTGSLVFGTGATLSSTTLTGNTTLANATTTSFAITNLTSGRVPFVATGGRLTDSSSLAFDGTTLSTPVLNLTTNSPVVATLNGTRLITASSTTGSVSLGLGALNSGDGSYNIALGFSALPAVSGSFNIAQGKTALFSNQAGSNNIAIGGDQALLSNTTGNSNIALGSQTLISNVSGSSNIGQGDGSLYANITGSKNIAFGNYAGSNLTAGDNNIVIGANNINFASSTGSNQLNIQNIIYGTGNSGTGSTPSTGSIGIGTTTPYSKLAVWGGTSGKIFEVVTSASSTALAVSATGFGTTTLSGLNINGSATSTSNVGMNLTAGCFAVNGTCLSTGSSGITAFGATGQTQTGATQTLATSTTGTDFTITSSGNVTTFNLPTASSVNTGKLSAADWVIFNNKISSTSIDTSAELLALVTDETGTGSLVFAGSPTLTGTITAAAATFSGNVTLTNATSTSFFAGNTTANTAAFGSTGSTTISSTGALATPGLTVGSLSGLLKATAGVVSAAVAGTDYANFGYLFPSNATSTLLSFNGGLTSYASTTIGAGGAATGLTISGNATTTGNAYFAGNVGIGTVAPAATLHVENGGLVTGVFVNSDVLGSGSGAGIINYVKALPNGSGQRLGYFGFGSRGGAENTYHGALIGAFAEAAWSAGSSYPSYLTFETAPSGSATRSERLRITSAGNVGIGTTSPTSALAVQGTAYFSSSAFFGGAITATSTLNVSGLSTFGNVAASNATSTNEFSGRTTANTAAFGQTGTTTVTSAGWLGVGTSTPWAQFSINPTSANGAAPAFVVGSSTATSFLVANTGNVGVGTTSPYANLSVRGTSGTIFAATGSGGGSLTMGGSGTFAVTGSSGQNLSLSASSFAAIVSGNSIGLGTSGLAVSTIAGSITQQAGTPFDVTAGGGNIAILSDGSYINSTPAGSLTVSATGFGTTTVTGLRINGSATSTSNVGMNLANGCFAVNGVCLSSGSSVAYPFGLTGNATSTLTQFNGGLTAYASSTIGNGTTGLTVSGGATTTGRAYFGGNVGIGTLVPTEKLSVENGNIFIRSTSDPKLSLATNDQDSIQWDLLAGVSDMHFGIYNNNLGAETLTISMSGDVSLNGHSLSSGSILVTGSITATNNIGAGTTTPGTLLSVGNTNGINFSEATSTFSSTGGINLVNGCYAVNGVCLTSGITAFGATGQTQTGATQTLATSTIGTDFTITSSGNVTTFNLPIASSVNTGKLSAADWSVFNNKISSTSIDTSAELLALVTDETGSGALVFAGSPTFTGTAAFANTTNSGTLAVTGNTTLANATSTNAFSGRTTANTAAFGQTGSTTITAAGWLGIGTSSPMSQLAIAGGNITQVASGNPTLKGTYDTSSLALDVVVSGKYAYVADFTSGLQVIDISNSAAPALVGTYNTSGSALDVVVSGKYAYVADGASGLQVIDISNSAAPALVGTYDTSGNASAVYVSGKYAYVADDTSGLQVIDISNSAAPALVGTYDTSGGAIGVYVSGKYAYVADGASGLQVIDISNSAAPALVGTYNTSGSATGVYVSGKYAYVADDTSGLQVIDISNSAAPALVGTYDTSGSAYDVAVSGKYAYVADNTSGLQVINISNSAAPALVGTYVTSGGATGVAVSGKYAYVADSLSGLQVIDINGAEFPTLAAGNIETNVLNALESIVAGGDIYAQGGLNVGLSGIFSRGALGVYTASTTAANPISATFMGGAVGIGTTTPYSKLSVWGGTSGTIFQAVTSASTTALSVSATGFGTTTLSGLTISGSATSTSNVGINLSAGCYAVNGTCLSSGAGTPAGSNTQIQFNNSGVLGASSRFAWNDTTRVLTVGETSTGSPTINLGTDASISATPTSGTLSITASSITMNGSTDNNLTSGGLTTLGGFSGLKFTTGASVERMRITGTGFVGVGTTTPWAQFSINPTSANGAAPAFAIGSSTATTFMVTNGGNVGVGTTSPWAKFSVEATAGVNSFAIGSSTSSYFVVNSAGNVGIGTSTPFSRFAVTNTASVAQAVLAYDATAFSQMRVDSTGDLLQTTSGGDYYLSNDNFWVCTGGSISVNGCMAGAPTGAGNLLVENKAGIGTSTPASKLTIETQDAITDFVQIASSTNQSIFNIKANGNVGIGTSSPFSKLAVGAGGAIMTVENGLSDGATIAIDWNMGNQQKVTLGGNRTITFSNYIAGATLRLVVCQDGTGSRTLTWPSVVRWPGGTVPTLTTTLNKCDLVTFMATNATSSMVVFGATALAF